MYLLLGNGCIPIRCPTELDWKILSYDKDKQKVVPPGAFSDPATWKVIPPGEFRPQCARPVGLMWRDHWE